MQLVLLRHGESTWNRDNRFTGWADPELSKKGVDEAIAAGRRIQHEGLKFDACYTSVLKRAIQTLWLVLEELDLMWLPVEKSWRLNERHYGALQGLNKTKIAELHGAEQVLAWRRSFTQRPPTLDRTDRRYPCRDPRYANLDREQIPLAESLKDAADRVLPYWQATIAPKISLGMRVLIVAHNNSLRALVKHLDALSDEEISSFELSTGTPVLYNISPDLDVTQRRYLS